MANKLQCAQNYCIWLVLNLKKDDRVSTHHKQIFLLTIYDLRSIHKLTMLHAILQTVVLTYLVKSLYLP